MKYHLADHIKASSAGFHFVDSPGWILWPQHYHWTAPENLQSQWRKKKKHIVNMFLFYFNSDMWKSKKRDHLQPYNHSLLKTKKQIGAMPCLKGYLFFVLQFRCWIPERIQEHESCQGPEGPDRPSPLTNTKANSRCEQSRSNISVYNQDKDCKHHWKKESFDWVYSISCDILLNHLLQEWFILLFWSVCIWWQNTNF